MYTPFTLLALSLAFASTNVLAAPAKAAAATGAGAAGAGAGAAGAAGTAGTAGCADMIIVFARGMNLSSSYRRTINANVGLTGTTEVTSSSFCFKTHSPDSSSI